MENADPIHPLRTLPALLAALLLAGCGRTGTGSGEDGPQVLDGLYDTSATGPLVAARRLNRDASDHHRLKGAEGPETAPASSPELPMPSFPTQPGKAAPALGARKGPAMAVALLKSSTGSPLAKAGSILAARAADTSGMRYGDSAKGYIQQVREADFSDSLGAGRFLDSLVYRWPHSPANPAVLHHVRAFGYADGRKARFEVLDEDGDGYLNQAEAGRQVRLRKEWVLRSGDTAWKTVASTLHGPTDFYDSLGAGKLAGWTDSSFVGARNIWWQRTYDGDGDSLILEAAAGKKLRVLRDAAEFAADGSLRADFEAFGPGPDGDYLKAADNEVFPFRNVVIGADGKDRSATRFGDADGDGFYWSSAAGATNRAHTVRTLAPTDSLPSWQDSLVQDLSASAGAGARILHYSRESRSADGVLSSVAVRLPPGIPSFAGGDTVQVRERKSYAGYVPKGAGDALGDLDSTVQVLWLIPGDPDRADDDRLLQWHRQDFHRAGRPLLSVSEQLRSDLPFAPGAAPASGTLLKEEIRRSAASSRSVVRSQRLMQFDGTPGDDPWKRIDWFESGDSAVWTGTGAAGGPSSYARALGPEARNAGWRDGSTGTFRDTVEYLDASGKPAHTEVLEGALKPSDGTGEYTRRRLGGPAGEIRYVLSREGGALRMLRISGGDTARLEIGGDTVSVREEQGSRTVASAWYPDGSGAFRLVQKIGTSAKADALGSGDYLFGADGSGAGVHKRALPAGGSKDGAVRFRADGSIHYDGVKVIKGGE